MNCKSSLHDMQILVQELKKLCDLQFSVTNLDDILAS